MTDFEPILKDREHVWFSNGLERTIFYYAARYNYFANRHLRGAGIGHTLQQSESYLKNYHGACGFSQSDSLYITVSIAEFSEIPWRIVLSRIVERGILAKLLQ